MLLNVANNLTISKLPTPENEKERIFNLAGYDLDYTDLEDNFRDLAKLAAKVSGTSISLVNVIDSLTQWTISNYGLDVQQILREDSICQYTIMEEDHFEILDLSADERFKDKSYVTSSPNARYYYGIPLMDGNGFNIGALCVMDQEKKVFDPEKIELLKIIAAEIVARLKTFKAMEGLKSKLFESNQTQKKLAHDIRGPLGGIVGLAGIIQDQGQTNQMDEVLEFVKLIHESGNSVLDLADEILSRQKTDVLEENEVSGHVLNPINLTVLKDKIEKLYQPQAVNKSIRFEVTVSAETESVIFSRNKLVQIAGNLISNAIKFTPFGGTVKAELNLEVGMDRKMLTIRISDTGIGMTCENIRSIVEGNDMTTTGTNGEQGYGFGLGLVKRLVQNLNGTFEISSVIGNGAVFTVQLPQK